MGNRAYDTMIKQVYLWIRENRLMMNLANFVPVSHTLENLFLVCVCVLSYTTAWTSDELYCSVRPSVLMPWLSSEEVLRESPSLWPCQTTINIYLFKINPDQTYWYPQVIMPFNVCLGYFVSPLCVSIHLTFFLSHFCTFCSCQLEQKKEK